MTTILSLAVLGKKVATMIPFVTNCSVTSRGDTIAFNRFPWTGSSLDLY